MSSDINGKHIYKEFLGGGAVINRNTAVQWNSLTKSLWFGITIEKGGGQ